MCQYGEIWYKWTIFKAPPCTSTSTGSIILLLFGFSLSLVAYLLKIHQKKKENSSKLLLFSNQNYSHSFKAKVDWFSCKTALPDFTWQWTHQPGEWEKFISIKIKMNGSASVFTFVTSATRLAVLRRIFLMLELSTFAVFATWLFFSDENSLTFNYWNNDRLFW